MKRFSKKALLTLLLLTTAGGFAACNKVTAIEVADEDMPQLTFVQGEELDLSKGMLTVTDKEGKKEIALNSKGVSISGYDKNTLGEQEIVIKYEGQKTTLKVKVVARIAAKNYEQNYFVGEDFNASKGNLTITNNDGTSFNVPMNDKNVTVGDLDSSAAATTTVSVQYNNGTLNYTDVIPVNVVEISSDSFSKPRDVVYQSYETQIVLDGCYITLKNGNLERYISVTEDMVSGFDISKATEANLETPLTQQLTVDYANRQYKFDVSIYYSHVTTIVGLAEDLLTLDWSGDEMPEISKAQGEAAIEAAKLYMDLEADEKDAVSDDMKNAIARTATVYAKTQWDAAVKTFEEVFTISDKGTFNISGGTYDGVQQAATALANKDADMRVYGSFLTAVAEEFAAVYIIGDTIVGDYLAGIAKEESIDSVVELFGFMSDMYAKLKNVPNAWTAADLANYKTDIDGALTYIKDNADKTSGLRQVYGIVSAWREKDDYFDILYTYYYDTENEDAINSLKNKQLPGKLETLYSALMSEFDYINYFKSYGTQTTQFMLLYNEINDIRKAVAAGDEGEMLKDLYSTLKFDGILVNSSTGENIPSSFDDLLMFVRNNGIFNVLNNVLENETVMTLWNDYLSVLEKANDDEEYVDGEEYKTAVAKLFTDFIAMKPGDQYAFLCSLNSGYAKGVPESLFDPENEYSLAFVDIIYDYFTNEDNGVLTAAAGEVFTDLCLAMEYFIGHDMGAVEQDYLQLFNEKMAAVEGAYTVLSTEDKAVFNQYMEGFYTQYMGIYADYKDLQNLPKTDLGEWADDFAAIEVALVEVYNALKIVESETDKYPYVVIFSSYQKAQALANKILTEAPAEIVNAYYYEGYDFEGFNVDWSMDSMMHYFGNVYTSYKTGLRLGDTVLYDYYSDGVEAFLSTVADILYANMFNVIDQTTTVLTYDAATVTASMKAFREMKAFDRYFFGVLDGNMDLYLNGLKEYFTTTYSAAVADVFALLQEAEQAYALYQYAPEGKDSEDVTYKAKFKTAYEAFATAYAKLTGDDLAAFASGDLGDMYTFYKTAYDTIDTEVQE